MKYYQPDPKQLAKAEAGDAEAQFDLACAYRFEGFDGEGAEEEKARDAAAFPWCAKAAAQGYADAEEMLGDCYRFGDGVGEDAEKARFWLLKAAGKNRAGAQFALGEMADEEEDYAEALKWFALAEQGGNEYASEELARYYEEGLGVPKDGRRAAEHREHASRAAAEQAARDAERDAYYKMPYEERYVLDRQKDAEQNVAGAEGSLAIYYYADKDYANAYLWARKGADKGDPRAQNIFARFFADGIGVKKDVERAKCLLIVSAYALLKNGDETANAKLLSMDYACGLNGFQRNEFAGACWATLAANAGDESEKNFLSRRKTRVDAETAEQFALAEKEAAERYLAETQFDRESFEISETPEALKTGTARTRGAAGSPTKRRRDEKEARKAESRAEKERRRAERANKKERKRER
jgi:TPR repeat protein